MSSAPASSPDYFRVERPAQQRLPVVVDVPHAGEWIPPEAAAEMVVQDQVLRRDLDLYVDQLFVDAPSLGATLVASNVSRYVVDLNRADDDISPETVWGGQRVDKPGYYQDRGVVWRTTTDGTPVMRAPMTKDAFARRIAAFHTPYHAALAAEIERVRQMFGFCVLIDGHSMPSQGRRGHADPGAYRADIVPGDVDGTSCASVVRDMIVSHFRGQGFAVRPNDPYKGGWITRNYGQPDADVHAIQIEINRRLYMDEQLFTQRPEGMKRLREACASLLPLFEGLEL